jgi:hypothetical protein
MFQAIGAMMGKAPNESPSAMLKSVCELQKEMKGEDTGTQFERFMKNLELAKSFVGSPSSGEDEGFGGIMKGLMPMVAAMAAQVQQGKQQPQQQQAPGSPGQFTPILPPAMPPNVIPMPGVTPRPVFAPQTPVQQQPEEGQDPAMAEQMRLLGIYTPLMGSIKRLLEIDRDAEGIVAYIYDQIDSGSINADDVDGLIDGAMAQMEMVPLMAAQFGITEPKHVEVLRAAISLYASDMDPGPEGAGEGGDVAMPGDHGQQRDAASGTGAGPDLRARPGQTA